MTNPRSEVAFPAPFAAASRPSGCAEGRHQSVVAAEALRYALDAHGAVTVTHLRIDRPMVERPISADPDSLTAQSPTGDMNEARLPSGEPGLGA
ncbi:hypothetical protein [Streptomyces zaomyceticus]|uniref:hypothetical protein n=1 Tax=Streptomyces zaomyceticus TaxID=68286 RepID=UPI00341C6858